MKVLTHSGNFKLERAHGFPCNEVILFDMKVFIDLVVTIYNGILFGLQGKTMCSEGLLRDSRQHGPPP